MNRSFSSALLHRLGCLVIGTPASLSMPDDFYSVQGDRSEPVQGISTFKGQRFALTVDAFRRRLTMRVAVLAAVASLAAVLAIQLLAGGVHGTANLFHSTAAASVDPTCAAYASHGLAMPANCQPN